MSVPDPPAPLYRRPVDRDRALRRLVLAGSLLPVTVLLALALLLLTGRPVFGLSPHRWIDLLALAVLAGLGPYGFWLAARATRLRRLEERFPDFLRDVGSSHQGGLTLSNAIAVAARGDYGALTPEIRKMADQLALNVALDEVLQRFADRVRTPLVRRAVALVLEATRSGGNTVQVIQAAARDVREIKTLEGDRRATMTLYTAVIYLTFLIFLGVAAVLYHTFLPQFARAAAASGADTGPGRPEFRAFYFLAALVQGVGNGLVAGALETGRWIHGLRHSFSMAVLAFVTFVFLLP